MKLSILRNNFFSTGAVDFALILLSAVTGILTARILGPENRGNLAIVILWPSVISSVGSLGVRDALVYYQAFYKGDPSKLPGLALILAIGQSALLYILGWFLIPVFVQTRGAEVVGATLVFLSFIPLNLISTFFGGLLQGGMEFSRFNLARLTVSLVYFLGILFIVAIDNISILSLAICLLISNLITAMLAIYFVYTRFRINLNLDLVLLKEIYGYGIRNHLGTISLLLNERLDQVLMALVLSSEQLGLYTLAVSYSSLVRLASRAFATLVFPRITAADLAQKRRIISDFSRASITSTLIIGIGMFAAAPFLIPFVYGVAFTDSVIVAEILVVATVFTGFGQTWSSSFRGLGFPMIPSRAEIISVSITGAGLAIFLPAMGMFGAAYVSLLAYFVTMIYLLYSLLKITQMPVKDLLAPIALPDLIPAIIKLSNST